MRNRAFRPIATILSLLLAAAVPAQASPVAFADVVHIISDGRDGVQDLRLRTVSQSNQTTGNTTDSNTTTSANAPSSLTGSAGSPVQQVSSGGNVETIETGDISGTICDCGEIPVPGGGGFPKLALLGLAAIPLAFIHGNRDTPTFNQPPVVIPTPTTTPPPQTPVPEPTTLLLFGSGLAALSASARRRYARSRMTVSESASLTEEV